MFDLLKETFCFRQWRKFLFVPSEFSDTGFVAGNFRPMDLMKLTSNYTNTIVPYDADMKLNLSYTVRKSRIATIAEKMSEYDYYDMDLKRNVTSGAAAIIALTYPLTFYVNYSVLCEIVLLVAISANF
jgi:hypothetical protein